MFIINPSGYCGANRSILQTGKKKTATSAPEAKATSTLETTLSWLDIIVVIRTARQALRSSERSNYLAGGNRTASIT